MIEIEIKGPQDSGKGLIVDGLAKELATRSRAVAVYFAASGELDCVYVIDDIPYNTSVRCYTPAMIGSVSNGKAIMEKIGVKITVKDV